MKLDQLATYLPLVVAVAFLAALTYCSGKFAYLDGSWLQALTVSDIFATAWRALPFSALGLLLGVFVDTRPVPRVLSDAELRDALHSWSPRRAIASHLLTLLAMAVFFGSFPLLAMASHVIPPERAHVMTFWAVLFSASAVVLMLRFGSHLNANFSKLIIYGTLIFTLSYSNGFAAGGAAAMMPRTDHVLFRDGNSVCGSIVYAGERGVLYLNSEGRHASLQGWELIDRVTTDSPACGTD